MSESSSEQGANSKKRTVAQLVDRLRAKTTTERLSLMAHLSVGRTLCRLRDAIANGEEVSQKTAMTLLCCGISLYRRHTLGDREEEDEDSGNRNSNNLSNEVWRMHLLPRRLRNETVVTVVQFRTGKLDVLRACCKNTTELLLPRRRPTLCRRRTRLGQTCRLRRRLLI